MGAQDKLVPAAGVIANNWAGTSWSTKSTFRLPAKKATLYKNPLIDAHDFLSSIHAKQLAIANNNHIWNGDMANTPPVYLSNQQLSAYSLDRGIHDEVLPGFAATTIEEWNELQTGISRAYNITGTVGIAFLRNPPYTTNEQTESLVRMGIFFSNQNLFNAVGGLLGVYAAGTTYADAWNSVKVPADAALGYQTNYIAPVYPGFLIAGVSGYYRYTGKSRWATPFTGWDLQK